MDLADWYQVYGEAVLWRCRRITLDDALAQDLLQETFLRAHRFESAYRGGSPLSWLLTIADRLCYDALRAKARQPILVDGEAPESLQALDLWPSTIRRDFIRELLAHTDERTALIVIRRFFDELSLSEIAKELDLNEKTIRRALKSFVEQARKFDVKKGASHAKRA